MTDARLEPVFPLEIFEDIISQLDFAVDLPPPTWPPLLIPWVARQRRQINVETLASCSLSCRSFVPVTRKILFRTLSIHQSTKSDPRTETLFRLLNNSHCTFPTFVKTLILRIDSTPITSHAWQKQLDRFVSATALHCYSASPSFLRSLEPPARSEKPDGRIFNQITELSVLGSPFSSMMQFVSWFPSLVKVGLKASTPSSGPLPNTFHFPSSLQTVKMLSSDAHLISQYLLDNRLTIEALHLQGGLWRRGDDESSNKLGEYLDFLGSALRHIRFRMNLDVDPSVHAGLFGANKDLECVEMDSAYRFAISPRTGGGVEESQSIGKFAEYLRLFSGDAVRDVSLGVAVEQGGDGEAGGDADVSDWDTVDTLLSSSSTFPVLERVQFRSDVRVKRGGMSEKELRDEFVSFVRGRLPRSEKKGLLAFERV